MIASSTAKMIDQKPEFKYGEIQLISLLKSNGGNAKSLASGL